MKKKYVMRIGLSLLGICLSTVFMWIMWRCLPNFYLICLSTNIENVVQVEFEIDEGWKLSVAGDNEMEPVKFLIDDPDTANMPHGKSVRHAAHFSDKLPNGPASTQDGSGRSQRDK